jgi:hypothetical protein
MGERLVTHGAAGTIAALLRSKEAVDRPPMT